MLLEIEHKLAEKLSEEYKKIIGKSAKKSQGDVAKFDKALKKTEKNSRALTKSRF